MKTKSILGYVFAASGLLLLLWSGVKYINAAECELINLAIGIVLCLVAALLFYRDRYEENHKA
ncbi:MAG: hypothetical protein ACRCZM_08825 [Bacteroidales bacterium]